MLDIFIYILQSVHPKSYIELPVRPQKGTTNLSVFDNYFREWATEVFYSYPAAVPMLQVVLHTFSALISFLSGALQSYSTDFSRGS